MNINTSNYYSVSGNTNKGFSGLASGIDTESMVEQMLAGTQSKIDKQQGLKQQSLWRQEFYREMITSINNFHNKYFDKSYGANTNMNFASSAFFNSMKSVIKSGNAVKVISSSSDAAPGDMDVIVKQLASKTKLDGEKGSLQKDNMIVSSEINEDIIKNVDRKVVLNVDGKDIEVNLNKATTQDEVISAFNEALKDTGVKASVNDDGNIQFKGIGSSKIKLGEGSTAIGLSVAGLSNVSSSEGKNTVVGSSVNVSAGFSFSLNLDGIQKNINITNMADENGDVTIDSIQKALSKEIKKAFGDYIEVGQKDGCITLKVNMKDSGGQPEVGHQLTVIGVDAKKLGLTPGATTAISMGTKLNTLGLNGDRFSFEINGEKFTFTGDDTIGTVLNKINSSNAGVKITYSSLSEKFILEADSTGKGYGIEIKQLEGDLLTQMFGKDVVGAGSSASGQNVILNTSGSLNASDRRPGLADDYTTKKASMDMTVNGRKYTFSLEEKEDGSEYTKKEIEDEFNKWLKEKFGEDENGKANISYTTDGKLHTNIGYQVTIEKSSANLDDDDAINAAGKLDLGVAMGFAIEGVTNIPEEETKVSDVEAFKDLASKITKDGVTTGELTLKDLQDGNAKITLRNTDGTDTECNIAFVDGRLTLTNTDGKTFNIKDNPGLENFFEGEQISFSDGNLDESKVVKGTDAIVEINGEETTRTSNTFTVDGITMEVTEVSKKNSNGEYEKTVIGTTRDIDTVIEGFKSLVNDYNEMIGLLDGYVSAKAEYKKYPPLTEAQRKEMSDREIELWEEKAKTGLLRGDDDVEQFLSSMRTVLYSKPEGAKFALYDIGIETGNYKDKGKLVINEAKLREVFSSDPKAVEQLFLDAQEGLSKQLIETMDYTAKLTGGDKAGTLVKLAGMEGYSSETNNKIYDDIKDIESRIKDLQYKYEREKARYWNQFNSMESILSNYNSQSMWLSQQFGSM